MDQGFLNHPHILAAIFKKITNPQELIKLRLVSKVWKEEVDRALKFANWKTLCEEKLGSFAYSTIIPTALPKISYKDYNDITEQSDWMKIFYSDLNWYSTICRNQLRIFSTKNLMWNRFVSHDNKLITCLDVWCKNNTVDTLIAHFVAWGSTKGSIHVFANFYMIKPYYIINTGKKQIKEIKFWFSASKELLLVSLDSDGHVTFWNVNQKAQKYIDAPEIHNGLKLYVNTSRSLFVALQNQIVRLQLLPTSKNEILVSKCDLNLTGTNHRILTINFFERDTVSAFAWTEGSWCQCFYYYNNIIDDSKNLDASNMERIYMPQIEFDPEGPYFSFFNKSVMYLSNHCLLVLNHLEYWKAFHMVRTFLNGGTIKSIAWHGNYLFIGLHNGHIQIYYIQNLEHLEDDRVFLDNQPKIIELDSEPIIDLKIGHIKEKPIIIAATKSCIYKIVNV